VKLAHAYSKIPSYSKTAVDLLNDLLFLNKASCIFRPHPVHQTEDFQNALLLLVTIYMNIKGHKKAADICEKYLKEDFGAYPVFYILGILRLREERREEAFSCFLNAVRLKPTHLPSLLELLRYLTSRSA
jgi:tetratricopeptide (TPR) repeat protein